MSYLHASGRCSRKCGLEGSALFTLSGRRAFFSAAVVLPLQPDEMIREALDSLTGLGGELVCCGIINRSCCSHDLVSAAQEGTSLAEERLCLLGCLRRRGGRAQVGGRAVCHGDSFPLSRRRDQCSGATRMASRAALTVWVGCTRQPQSDVDRGVDAGAPSARHHP